MKQFLDGFNFDPRNPPNAAIVLKEGEEESDIVVVELTAPQYDETNGTLTYKAAAVDDYEFESEWSKDLVSRADSSIPETFGAVILVIDDCPCLWNIAMGDCDNNYYSTSWRWVQLLCNYDGGCCEKCHI